MIFKILKNSMDYAEGKPHEPKLSRRDFLQEGAYLGGIFMTVPIWASIFRTDKALADAISEAANVNPCSFTFEENAGGCGYSNVFGVTLQGNQLYAGVDTRSLGIRANQTWRQNLVKGLAFNNRDSYLTTVLAGGAINIPGMNVGAFMTPQMAATLMSRTAGFRIACAKNDDTDKNALNPLEMVQAMRVGSLVKTVGATGALRSNKIGGGKSLSIVSAGNVSGLVNSVNLQNANLNNPTLGGYVADATAKLNAAQAGNRAGRVGFSELMRNLASALPEVPEKYDPNVASRAMDPMDAANSAGVAAVLNYNALSDREKLIFATFLSNARGISGSCYISNNGYDYHNGQRDAAERKHAEMARIDLLWMAAQQIAGKPGLKYRATDGGINWSSEDAPRALGDRGGSGQGICMIYRPNGVANLAVRDVGHFLPTSNGGGESPDRNVFVSKDPRHEGICAMVNWAKLAGIDMATVKAMVSQIVRNDADFNSLFAV